MTQPPYGEPQQPPYGEPPHYPQQELLPQQVLPGRNRLPLVIGAVAVVLALVAGLVAWRLVHDNGEDNRAAYCNALKRLTSADGLSGLTQDVGDGGTGVPKAITDLVDLAPGSVSDQWHDLLQLVQSASGGQPDVGQIAQAFTDLQAIIADANSACGLDLQFPT
jgi:hypothetical protein